MGSGERAESKLTACSFLIQRGIYPPESFARVSKYGLQMLVTSDAGLQKYLQQVLTQLSEWLYAGSVQKLVLVITSLENQTVELRGHRILLCDALVETVPQS